MPDLSTAYLGLSLPNPVIVGSSGLTSSVEQVQQIEQAGAGAVVLKSVFEEQIRHETQERMDESELGLHPEASEYLSSISRDYSLHEYLKLIERSRKKVSIPVIASVNCVSGTEWVSFAHQIEGAGAQALELNVLPTDYADRNPRTLEHDYLRIVEKILDTTSLPIALKIGAVFTNIPQMLATLSSTGIAGLTMFNRYWCPDIDIEKVQLVSGDAFSSGEDLGTTLRWVGYVSNFLDCDIAGSGGVHDSAAVVKMLLAGATVTQVVSALYRNGVSYLTEIVDGLERYLKEHNTRSVDQIRGVLAAKNEEERRQFGRTQFIKYYAELE